MRTLVYATWILMALALLAVMVVSHPLALVLISAAFLTAAAALYFSIKECLQHEPRKDVLFRAFFEGLMLVVGLVFIFYRDNWIGMMPMVYTTLGVLYPMHRIREAEKPTTNL